MVEKEIDSKVLYLGTWFPRTNLHLQEVYKFLSGEEIEGLDQGKLKSLYKALRADKVIFHQEGVFDMVEALCGEVRLLMTEDGIILLRTSGEDLENSREILENFYEKHLGPAITFLFSRGAPLPKNLLKVKEVYPLLLLITKGVSREEVTEIFLESKDAPVSSVSAPNIEIFFGKELTIFNTSRTKEKPHVYEELLMTLVFFREFEGQLGRYLNLHRIMWDEITKIRESKELKYKDFPSVREKILEHLKTLSFMEARLAQMLDILSTRSTLAHQFLRTSLGTLGLLRFDHLRAQQEYVGDLWQMTVEYTEGTLTLLNSLFQENTQKELNALKFITLIGAVTSFFGMNIAFPWEERWPDIFPSSLAVVGLVMLSIAGFYFFLKYLIYNRRFSVHDGS